MQQKLRSLFPVGGPVSRTFRKCAADPTFLCVDSAPLQRLSRRFRAICQACQQVCDAEAPRSQAAVGGMQVMKAERRVVMWFQLGAADDVPCGSTAWVHTLEDFGKVGWPRVEVGLAKKRSPRVAQSMSGTLSGERLITWAWLFCRIEAERTRLCSLHPVWQTSKPAAFLKPGVRAIKKIATPEHPNRSSFFDCLLL